MFPKFLPTTVEKRKLVIDVKSTRESKTMRENTKTRYPSRVDMFRVGVGNSTALCTYLICFSRVNGREGIQTALAYLHSSANIRTLLQEEYFKTAHP